MAREREGPLDRELQMGTQEVPATKYALTEEGVCVAYKISGT
jgi:hypothetical protein